MTEVAEKVQTVEERMAALEKKLDIFSVDHMDFRKVHLSRKGPEGGRGLTGEIGPQGVPGRDADVRECVEAAKQAFREEFSKASVRQLVDETRREIVEEYGSSATVIRQIVLHELKVGGVLDENGQAILLPGPVSTTPGPIGQKGEPGRDGQSIVGRDGRDGQDANISIGSVTAGTEASVTMREHEGVQFLDVVLPRGEKGEPGVSNIPGPQGDRGEMGPEGLRGYTGIDGFSREQVIALIADLKARGYFRQ